MREAVSQWNGASLGSTMSYYYTPEEASGADIHYFGGTREEILDIYCFSNSDFDTAQNTHGSVAGHTQCSRYEMDSWTYSGNGSVKTGYVIDYVRGFVLDYERELTTASRNKYYKTCTHELGHALGWFGHSSIVSDVMYTYVNTYTTLSSTERTHLKQVYDLA